MRLIFNYTVVFQISALCTSCFWKLQQVWMFQNFWLVRRQPHLWSVEYRHIVAWVSEHNMSFCPGTKITKNWTTFKYWLTCTHIARYRRSAQLTMYLNLYNFCISLLEINEIRSVVISFGISRSYLRLEYFIDHADVYCVYFNENHFIVRLHKVTINTLDIKCIALILITYIGRHRLRAAWHRLSDPKSAKATLRI